MRTTVSIDDDLLSEAKVLAAQTSRTLGSVVEDALRLLLRNAGVAPAGPEWDFPTGGAGGLRPGVDLADRDALSELLGDNALPGSSVAR